MSDLESFQTDTLPIKNGQDKKKVLLNIVQRRSHAIHLNTQEQILSHTLFYSDAKQNKNRNPKKHTQTSQTKCAHQSVNQQADDEQNGSVM